MTGRAGGGPALVVRALRWLTADDSPRTDQHAPATAGPVQRVVERAVALERSHPRIADAVLAGAILALAGYSLTGGGAGSTTVLAVFVTAMAVPLVWRRRYPIAVYAVTLALLLAQWGYAQRALGVTAVVVSLYTVARHAPRRVALAAAATAEAAAVAATATAGEPNSTQFLLFLTAMIAAPCFLGIWLRTRKAYLAALVERARRLERERDQQARIAAAAERASIAREMHDIVAHSLAVIITMGEAAAAKQRSDPERAAAAMRQVADTGRQALDQTRRLLGVWRTETPAPGAPAAPDVRLAAPPQPGLAQLDTLLEEVRATGLDASLTVTGHRLSVAADAQLAIYRIVQEALTNTIRHARDATSVRVRLKYSKPAIEIDVADDGQEPLAGREDAAGHGLDGMRERVALYGGTLIAGPRHGGGWRVSACLSPAAQPVASPGPASPATLP